VAFFDATGSVDGEGHARHPQAIVSTLLALLAHQALCSPIFQPTGAKAGNLAGFAGQVAQGLLARRFRAPCLVMSTADPAF